MFLNYLFTDDTSYMRYNFYSKCLQSECALGFKLTYAKDYPDRSRHAMQQQYSVSNMIARSPLANTYHITDDEKADCSGRIHTISTYYLLD